MKKVDNYKRIDLFNYYHECNNPHIIVTVPINVTKIVNYCKVNKNFYATMGYAITKTVNEIDAFKYRYKDGEFYYCDKIDSNYTQMKSEDLIGYFDVSYDDNYDKYINSYQKAAKDFFEGKEVYNNGRLDKIWLSTAPWFSFSSLVTPFNKNVLIPQFIWDKYVLKGDKYYVNLMIMIHHGFVDGFHIHKFIEKLEENIYNFN